MAADPTYPLYPILSLLSATLLLGILTTNFIRHSWNLGITFLCFWLFWNNLSSTIGAIVWSDNADIKLYFWCDIVSHLNLFTHIVKPACTLILTRRLYKIASLRSLVPESRKEKIVDAAIEWCLGLGLPALVTGAFYYIVQEARFEILEGIGCTTAVISSGLSVLLIESPGIILPSISTLFYCPKIIYVFFRHSRDTNEFLQTNGFMSRSGYSHILALGCLDILLTLPFGIIQVVGVTHAVPPGASLPLYPGWRRTHLNWKPVSSSWNDVEQGGALQMFCLNVGRSSPVILAFAISAVFGFTGEARAMYRRGIRALMNMTKLKSLEPDKEAGIRSSTFVAVYGARTEDRNAGRGDQTSVLKADSFLARSPISDADQYIPNPLDNGCTVGAPWLLESNYSEDTVASGAGNKETSRSVESQNDKGGGYHARRASYNSTDVPHFVDSSRSDTGATAPRSSAFSEVV